MGATATEHPPPGEILTPKEPTPARSVRHRPDTARPHGLVIEDTSYRHRRGLEQLWAKSSTSRWKLDARHCATGQYLSPVAGANQR